MQMTVTSLNSLKEEQFTLKSIKPEGQQAFQSQPINPTPVMVSASFSGGGSNLA